MSRLAGGRVSSLIAIVFTALFVASPTLGTAALQVIRPTGNPAKGRDVFVSKGCVACHSVRGAGGKVGPDLSVVLVNKSLFDIAAEMWSHAPAMKAAMTSKGLKRLNLSPTEVKDLIAYLLFIGFSSEPGDDAQGRLVFNVKGCVKCHAFGGNGGKIGPSLDPMPRSLSTIGIAQEMWNHGPAMTEQMAAANIKRPVFRYGEMANLIAFLRGPGRGEIPPRSESLPGDPQVGKKLFASKGCVKCHQSREEGTTIGPDLASGTWYRTSTEMAAVMWNHGPAMAKAMKERQIALPRFEGNQLADILAYLYVLRSADKVGDPARGKEIFSSKNCAKCHSQCGPGPVLAASAALRSPAHLASAMWNHAPEMVVVATKQKISWPALDGGELGDLVAYLLSAAQAEPPAAKQSPTVDGENHD